LIISSFADVRCYPFIAFSLFGMINWIYRWFNEEGSLSLDEVALRTIEILFAGLMPERQIHFT